MILQRLTPLTMPHRVPSMLIIVFRQCGSCMLQSEIQSDYHATDKFPINWDDRWLYGFDFAHSITQKHSIPSPLLLPYFHDLIFRPLARRHLVDAFLITDDLQRRGVQLTPCEFLN
jgi:hypothetical protein